MRRWLAVAALSTAFVAMPLWGQRHGGGGFGGRGAMVGAHGPGVAGRGFVGVRPARSNWGFGFRPWPFTPGFPFFPGRPFFHHHHFYPYYGYGHGGYGYGGYLGYDYYGDNAYSPYPPQYYPTEDYLGAFNPQIAQIQQQQQAELDRLSDEVARLREQQAESHSASQPVTPTESTQLVFADQHTEEVQNYAIIGKTLWVFTEKQARKIPLSDLDIPATQRANQDRGFEFEVPK